LDACFPRFVVFLLECSVLRIIRIDKIRHLVHCITCALLLRSTILLNQVLLQVFFVFVAPPVLITVVPEQVRWHRRRIISPELLGAHIGLMRAHIAPIPLMV